MKIIQISAKEYKMGSFRVQTVVEMVKKKDDSIVSKSSIPKLFAFLPYLKDFQACMTSFK